MNTTPAAIETRRAALFARASTPTLVQSALTLAAKANLDEHERLTLAWIRDELETRCGGVQDEVAFCELLDAGMTYDEALLATFPQLAG